AVSSRSPSLLPSPTLFRSQPTWHAGAVSDTSPGPADSPSATPTATETISLSATGDIIMADVPGRIPPNGGRGFFADVREALAARSEEHTSELQSRENLVCR